MSPLERETKLIVLPDDAGKIRRAGQVVSCADQLNIYLQDPARLSEPVGYCRVRFETGAQPVATLKVLMGWKGHIREMMELERPLAELGPDFYPRPRRWVRIDSRAPEGFMEHFSALGIRRLRRLGWMRNRRWVVRLGTTGMVEVDRTVLPDGTVHYEVEIEHPSEERQLELTELLRKLAPSAEPTRLGKYTRFLAATGLL